MEKNPTQPALDDHMWSTWKYKWRGLVDGRVVVILSSFFPLQPIKPILETVLYSNFVADVTEVFESAFSKKVKAKIMCTRRQKAF